MAAMSECCYLRCLSPRSRYFYEPCPFPADSNSCENSSEQNKKRGPLGRLFRSLGPKKDREKASPRHKCAKPQHQHQLNVKYLAEVQTLLWCGSLKNSVAVQTPFSSLDLPSGQGKWQACHEFKPSTAEDPPCKGDRCTLNMSRLKRPPVGVVWKLRDGVLAVVSPSSLDLGSES
ncbi:uncharacterized protein TNCV_3629371 [Trichonephila clavipes]|nr:uncharacterized protein TNCV_3629371 [Trichonephila clavipes]